LKVNGTALTLFSPLLYKTMTLSSVLQSIQGVVLANLNFSSRTTPEIILKTFSQYCSYVRRGKDIYLEPSQNLGDNKWLVVFCDEINLPEEDTYGTQRVIMFMRQLIEHGGFWRVDNIWVKINRIQFVGACNPPTDAGRVDMSHRFLRHVPLLLVDFPEKDSLMQIYRTFNGGMMKLFPNLKGETDAMTEAMVEVYLANQSRFTPELQPQYFYSPRELSRWVRGIYESVVNIDHGLTREELVRVWAHEALRLFADRLVEREDQEWCSNKIDEVARKWFAGVDYEAALARPMFYTTWLSKETRRVEKDDLKDFLSARLRVFYEEELDVQLVIFDEVLEHILRIDRVLRQPMGHLLLVGDSGAGKTVLSKFVSWMNGLNIFQIKAHSRYGLEDFNEDLRTIMRRVGVDGEKICFIFDESNVLSSGFIEAINALLASGEVPGLFEGDDLTALMSSVRDSAMRDGTILDSEEDIWRYFTGVVQRNLHVVFTVNPSGGDWKNRSTTSPALFNRCVVDWFGTWGRKAMAQVGKEFTLRLDMGDSEVAGGSWGIGEGEDLMKQVEEVFDGPGGGSLRQAVVAALVALHHIAKSTAAEAASEASSITKTFLSPRDYLALIQNFVKCLNSRREQVEDEQLHVNAGLDKLRQTQENVAELKKALGVKTTELKKKESLANEKLQQMVADQNVAEKRKEEAVRMNVEVAQQQKQINQRKEEAQRDLDEAEPALRSAQESVRGIKKRDLDEVRNLGRPPDKVKLTLECVAIMMGEKSIEWADIRKVLSRADFIPTILNFDADKLSSKQINLVNEKYLEGNPDLTTESVTRSSKACGPLFKWAESQIKYSTIYNNVQPLREEVEQLQTQAQVVKDEKEKIEAEVNELESSIAQYKSDYASLIRDVEALKAEMGAVTTKIDRAESLLNSLGHESERWAKSSETFQTIMRSLVGDGLLMAAFLTYTGFFDFHSRSIMMSKWKKTLESLDIEFRPDLGFVESLSTASQRLTWKSEGLPGDDLSLENGVILDHATRFPLVIDPSGQAISFIMKKYSEEKIQTTSFLDKAFTKTLAGAVRFGTALLVENVEKIDPILNPILNKELQRTGGRTLVRIGTEDVDYSPKFRIILSTKNPAVQLTPDVCSRVTLVNFTVTPDSLQSQSLSHLVRALKPELETQRASLLKLQGEQNVKLRELEDQMLSKISACEGSILDDDRVVEGMEVLMQEGSQVEQQISQSEEVMTQVHQAVARFEPFAMICRQVFVLFEALREISFLYEFPAQTFMSILEHVLDQESNEEDEGKRLAELKTMLFHETVARIGRGLQVEDKLVFSILLARLYKGDKNIGAAAADSSTELIALITKEFGEHFLWQGRALNHLEDVTEFEIGPTVPLLLCSAPGHDVSGRVEAMARELKKELAAVAMGSTEGFDTADSLVGMAAKRGTWVMLKNVHLCVDWLRESLVKKLQSLSPANTHKDFRIFITSEINPRLPPALLRICDLIVAQAPTGIKASLTRFFSSISKDRFSLTVRNRLYLLLGWTHAVIQERLRFVPNGWTEAYEFTEADATHALDVIDSLLETGDRQTLDPEKLPWDAIRSTLCKSVFGGRVTSPVDQTVLDNLVNSLFVSESFNVDFAVVQEENVTLPESTTREQCLEWIAHLPEYTPPTWIGLDRSAEVEREQRSAHAVSGKVVLIQEKCDSD
jgi:dynein heavy chain 1